MLARQLMQIRLVLSRASRLRRLLRLQLLRLLQLSRPFRMKRLRGHQRVATRLLRPPASQLLPVRRQLLRRLRPPRVTQHLCQLVMRRLRLKQMRLHRQRRYQQVRCRLTLRQLHLQATRLVQVQ